MLASRRAAAACSYEPQLQRKCVLKTVLRAESVASPGAVSAHLSLQKVLQPESGRTTHFLVTTRAQKGCGARLL